MIIVEYEKKCKIYIYRQDEKIVQKRTKFLSETNYENDPIQRAYVP